MIFLHFPPSCCSLQNRVHTSKLSPTRKLSHRTSTASLNIYSDRIRHFRVLQTGPITYRPKQSAAIEPITDFEVNTRTRKNRTLGREKQTCILIESPLYSDRGNGKGKYSFCTVASPAAVNRHCAVRTIEKGVAMEKVHQCILPHSSSMMTLISH